MKLVKCISLFLINLSYGLNMYPYDPRIHNFGNVGLGGKFHALLARPITKVIDVVAYNGVNIRNQIVKNLTIQPDLISDWCCGTGMSTDAIYSIFKNSSIIGVDTSNEMICVADKLSHSNADFIIANAENVKLERKMDLITIMFGFHEIPQEGRVAILKNVKKNLKKNGTLLIVDIDLTYNPSNMMLTGEPYIRDYFKNVENDIYGIFPNTTQQIVVPGHVRQWNCNFN